MTNFFGKLKNKKNKWFFYLIFWIFFPLAIIGMIVSLCYSPNSFSSDKSSSYVKSLEFKLNFSNNSNDVNNLLATKQEATQAANNYLEILKAGGFSSVNVQPYVYSVQNNGTLSYYYGLNLIFSSPSTSSIMNAYLYVNTFYDNSNLMTLDSVTPQTQTNIVQYATSSSTASKTYYASSVIAGLTPSGSSTNNPNNVYVSSGNQFYYNSIKLKTNDKVEDMYINLQNPIEFTDLVNNQKDQLIWWNNKAAFVNLCNNLYSLYWIYQNWWSLGSVIPASYYNNQSYAAIQSMWSEIKSDKYADFAEALYSIIGSNNWQYLGTGITTSGFLTKDYNLITLQNIDNILLSTVPGTTETLYTKYKSTIDSYVLADINSTNYTTYFSDIVGNSSSTMTFDMSNLSSSSSSSSSSEASLQVTRWKYNMLNPLQSPANSRDSNSNTYSNVNINPFSLWNNINLLIDATNSTSDSSTTSAIVIKPTTLTTINPLTPQLTWNITSTQPTSISYTSSYMLSNSVTHLSAWKAGLITVLIVILLIGIIVSLLYRFPGLIAWVVSTLTLGLASLIYKGLSLQTTDSTFLAYLIAYVMTISIFIIFLQKVNEIYKSGISFKLAILKGIKYYIAYSLDLHILMFLFALGFVYFSEFELQLIGIVIAIYFAISFLINYLFMWFLLICYSNLDFESNYNFYTTYFAYKENKKNYETLSTIAFKINESSYYNLSDLDSVISTKNTLSIYLKPNKRKRILFFGLNSLAILLMVVFFAIIIAFYYQHNLYMFNVLNANITHNILGNYLFDHLLTNILIAIGLSSIYVFLRFGKAIIYFITSSISSYLLISFFLFCQIPETVTNVEGLALGLFFVAFINAYCNVFINHLFKFKQEIKLKDAYHMIINVFFKQAKTYLITTAIVLLMMIVSYIFNSTDYFLLNILLFMPFVYGFIICLLFIPVLRVIALYFKNLFFVAESNIKFKNYDLVEEQIIEGINSFKKNNIDEFIYE